MKLKKTDEFTVQTADSDRHIVFEWTEFKRATDRDVPPEDIEGYKELRTSKGYRVNWRGGELYEIILGNSEVFARRADTD